MRTTGACSPNAARWSTCKTSVEQQLERTRHGRHRPLLNDTDPEEKLRELMLRRAALYAEIADLTVSTDGRRVQTGGRGDLPRASPGAPGSKLRIIPDVQTLQVDVGHSQYPITIGSGLLSNRELFAAQIPGPRPHDRHQHDGGAACTSRSCAQTLGERSIAECILPDGEQHKTLQTAGWVFDALVGQKLNRDATVLALGGGVVGDIAGFVAACYQRGVGYVQIPTTLLAQVDSSVGGKTGVNHSGGKNLIGAFYQPLAVHRRHGHTGDACRTASSTPDSRK